MYGQHACLLAGSRRSWADLYDLLCAGFGSAPICAMSGELVCDAPVLDDLAVLKAALIHDGDGERLAGRRHAGERSP